MNEIVAGGPLVALHLAPDEMIHIFLKWLDHLLNVITTMFLAFLLLGKDGQTSIGVPQNSLFFLGDSDIPNIFCDWMLLV